MKELDRAAVLARYGWTEDDFTTAVSLTEPCKFPSAQKHKTRPGGYGLVPVWLEHQLQRWEETVAGHVAVLRGLLRK
jgi:hypothetical protein